MLTKLIPALSVATILTGTAFAQTSTTTTTTTITDDQAAKVKTYVMKEKRPAAKFSGTVAVGTALPADVQFYDIPADAGVKGYRYGVVNDQTVIVEPSTRKIIRIIE